MRALHCGPIRWHRRRNRGGGGGGGSGGHLPPQAAGRGGSAPTTKAMPGCRTRPDYDSFHEYRQLQSILYLTYSSFLHCYNQETLVYLCQAQTLASLMQKWVWFCEMWAWSNFFRALRAQLIYYAPTATTSNIFLHLWMGYIIVACQGFMAI